jgi:N-acetylglucosaminyldiphosphoundecaprenol N-acetyl-beta-D-mannosaminyltransferase
MNRVRLFGVEIDPLRMTEAVAQLLDWADRPNGACRFVVTPNADHAVMLQEHAGLRQAYAAASLVLVDGMPLLLASKLLRRGIPQRVPGSDLVPALFNAADERTAGGQSPGGTAKSLKVFLLGAGPGVAQKAAERIAARWPNVKVVGCYSPPLGFESDACENRAILDRIAAAGCDVLLVGLGAPKQELWVHEHCGRIAAPVALCIGATIDFLAGEKGRAPVWMRRVGLEWLHRLASEPRRLAGRYYRDAVRFPGLILNEFAANGQTR